MKKIGISIYPEKSDENELLTYIDKASKLGFKRIFSCLLSVNDTKENILKKFKKIDNFAKNRGFEIIFDVNPEVLKKFNVTDEDLSFFKEINADGIRLDGGYGGLKESLMTFNKENLNIEINMSNSSHYLDTIMDYMPNKEKLIGCHNFYPHKYSGLSLDFFNECTKKFNNYGLRTAAFVTSQQKNAYGPWNALDFLPTLEMHRYLPIQIQAKHFVAMSTINDIIISNCYPSDEELKKLASINLDMINFEVELEKDLSDFERKIVLDEIHYRRGDTTEYIIRSSATRIKYNNVKIKPFNVIDIKKGDIIIDNENSVNYNGELQIALTDMKNTGYSNVVGRIKKEEIFICDFIKKWQKFCFTEY